MDRKIANIILKVLVTICIVTSAAWLLYLLLCTDAWMNYRAAIIQLVICLILSVALGLYICNISK